MKLLYKEGFIQSYLLEKTNKGQYLITVKLRYSYNKSVIGNLKILSKPSISRFLKYKNLCLISEKRSLIVLSTDKGFLTTFDCKKNKLGGKLFFIC